MIIVLLLKPLPLTRLIILLSEHPIGNWTNLTGLDVFGLWWKAINVHSTSRTSKAVNCLLSVSLINTLVCRRSNLCFSFKTCFWFLIDLTNYRQCNRKCGRFLALLCHQNQKRKKRSNRFDRNGIRRSWGLFWSECGIARSFQVWPRFRSVHQTCVDSLNSLFLCTDELKNRKRSAKDSVPKKRKHLCLILDSRKDKPLKLIWILE